MNRLLTLFIALLLAPLVGVGQSTRYLSLAAAADSAIADADWQRAAQLIQNAIDTEPSNPANVLLVSNLGMVLHNAGNDSLALATLDRAVAMAPRSVTVISNRGRLHASMGNTRRAYDDFGLVAQLDSTLSEPLFYHGILAMQLGDMEQAALDFDRLAILAPDDPETHIAHAAFYEAVDESQGAIDEYSWLIDKAPEALYYSRRAALYIPRELLNEASQDIADGLRLDPTDPELYLLRAILNKKRFRPREAADDARRAVELGMPQATVQQILGNLQ